MTELVPETPPPMQWLQADIVLWSISRFDPPVLHKRPRPCTVIKIVLFVIRLLLAEREMAVVSPLSLTVGSTIRTKRLFTVRF